MLSVETSTIGCSVLSAPIPEMILSALCSKAHATVETVQAFREVQTSTTLHLKFPTSALLQGEGNQSARHAPLEYVVPNPDAMGESKQLRYVAPCNHSRVHTWLPLSTMASQN